MSLINSVLIHMLVINLSHWILATVLQEANRLKIGGHYCALSGIFDSTCCFLCLVSLALGCSNSSILLLLNYGLKILIFA